MCHLYSFWLQLLSENNGLSLLLPSLSNENASYQPRSTRNLQGERFLKKKKKQGFGFSAWQRRPWEDMVMVQLSSINGSRMELGYA